MTQHEFFGALAVVIGFLGSAIYIFTVLKGRGRPHFFTWLVWTLLAVIGYCAQLHGNAGPGSWVMGVTALSCALIAVLSLKYGETTRTRGDWVALSVSLMAIVPWILTDDPLGSVIMISAIDLVAMAPTFRKSWSDPYGESLSSYTLASAKFVFSLFALETFTATTAIYPLSVIAANCAMTVLCLWRRNLLCASEQSKDI